MKASDFWTEEQKKKAKERGLARLNKIMPIYVAGVVVWGVHAGRDYKCYYLEKGVVKYANIGNPYMLRYGPSVIATLKGKSPVGLWQISKGAINDEIFSRMFALAVDGKLDLPVMNLDEFTFES